MSLVQKMLEPPRYGFERDRHFYRPSSSELWREFRFRVNPFRDRKNWLSFTCWFASLLLCVPQVIFWAQYWTLSAFLFASLYAIVILPSHGTLYLHRYCTHRAFEFSSPLALFMIRNMVIKIVPEETYAISHFVHHQLSDSPGDPYYARGGWLYCFLADAIHQPISKTLNAQDYEKISRILDHTGIHRNSYSQYQFWGSIAHPAWTILHYTLNWAVWGGIFFLIGGIPLMLAIFGMSSVWAFGVRTFNFAGHGRGKDQRRKGIDFNWADHSVNQTYPGWVAGEWHNNHHLFPYSARAGFLPHQPDLPFYFIRFLKSIGWVSTYKDLTQEFIEKTKQSL